MKHVFIIRMKPTNEGTIGIVGNTSISTISGDPRRYMQSPYKIEVFNMSRFHSQGNVIQERNIFQDLSAEWLQRQWISTPMMDDFDIPKEKDTQQLLNMIDEQLKEMKAKDKAMEEDELQQNKEPCDSYPLMDDVD